MKHYLDPNSQGGYETAIEWASGTLAALQIRDGEFMYHLSDSFDTNYSKKNYAMLCITVLGLWLLCSRAPEQADSLNEKAFVSGHFIFSFRRNKLKSVFGTSLDLALFIRSAFGSLLFCVNFFHFGISMTNDFQMNVEIEIEWGWLMKGFQGNISLNYYSVQRI